jgi:hypothetical protein
MTGGRCFARGGGDAVEAAGAGGSAAGGQGLLARCCEGAVSLPSAEMDLTRGAAAGRAVRVRCSICSGASDMQRASAAAVAAAGPWPDLLESARETFDAAAEVADARCRRNGSHTSVTSHTGATSHTGVTRGTDVKGVRGVTDLCGGLSSGAERGGNGFEGRASQILLAESFISFSAFVS